MAGLLTLIGLMVALVMIFDLRRELKLLRQRVRLLEHPPAPRLASTVAVPDHGREQVAAESLPSAAAGGGLLAVDAESESETTSESESESESETTSGVQPAATAADPWGVGSTPTSRWGEVRGATQLWSKVYDFFTTGNLVVRIGMVILFFGVSFLLKYAAEHSNLPIELRLVGIAAAALGVFGVGWRLRQRRPSYALILQGGGIGMLYLTVFASAKLYQLLPLGMVFVVMGGLVVVSGLLAVLQDARSLALFGAAGGFLAPILTSTGSGSHLLLFSYYALLNVGIFGIAWFKAWRSLNLLGFLFTFVIGAAWGFSQYRPHHFETTEPFLLLFFLFYVGISVLYALRQPPNLKGYVDASLVFGVPLTALGLQAAMVHRMEYGMALSALALAGFYIVLAVWLWRRHAQGLRLLVESFMALGVGFLTLAIPFALDDELISIAWGLEGAAMVWIGARQQRALARWSGIALQGAAGLTLALLVYTPYSAMPLLNASFMGGLLVAMAGLFSGYTLYRQRDGLGRFEHKITPLILAWGVIWWLESGSSELERILTHGQWVAGMVGYLTLSAWLLRPLYRCLDWPAIGSVTFGYLPLLLIILLGSTMDGRGHPLGHWGGLVWPLAMMTLYRVLADLEGHWSTSMGRLWHLGGLGLWVALLIVEGRWWVGHGVALSFTWELTLYGVLPAMTALALLRFGSHLPWPIAGRVHLYVGEGIALINLGLVVWMLCIIGHDAAPGPLNYLPLLNPLELSSVLVLLLFMSWAQRLKRDQITLWGYPAPLHLFTLGLAAITFMVLNTMVARTVHFWDGVPYRFESLFAAGSFQSAIAILWMVTALMCMVFASRRSLRGPWVAGALLIAAVVVKLFVIDLDDSGAVPRIISFLGVGGLMLVIGYFSPLPPRVPLSAPIANEADS